MQIQDLNKYHDAWLINGLESDQSNTIVIDCNEDFESDADKQREMIEKKINKNNIAVFITHVLGFNALTKDLLTFLKN